MTNLTNWKETAKEAATKKADAATTSEAKKAIFNKLAFMSLQILLEGKIQDKQALAQAVSKNGEFHSLRQCVSNARPIALSIQENGSIEVTEGKGENRTVKTYSKEDVLTAPEPAFTVSTVYRNMRKTKEDIETTTDEDALQEYATNSGMTVREIKNMYDAETLADAIKQGHVLIAEQHKQNIVDNAAVIAETLKEQYSELATVAPDIARTLLDDLNKAYPVQEKSSAKKATKKAA